ncbi:MAG: hypothetical protein K9G49_05715 [Taibaiella sp.]|nr:hypothetical protein [Taibaiella sp.]
MLQPNKGKQTKSKLLTTAIVMLALLYTNSATAQYMPKQPKPKARVRLANMERTNIPVKTILADPRLVSAKASCEVTSFEISFHPEGGVLSGPYKTTGAMLSEKQISYLKSMADANVKILIDQIHLSCNGKDVTEEPIRVVSFP